MDNIPAVPKAELHVHLEGTMLPSLARTLAERHDLPIPEAIFGPGETFVYSDFLDFMHAYDQACQVIRTGADYRTITYDYLRRSAAQGSIYVEMTLSPDHAALSGIDYPDLMDNIVAAIDDARRDFAIEGRILIGCVRHFGVDACMRVVDQAIAESHPYVVGISLAGDEVGFPPGLFKKVFARADHCNLGCSAHAGETAGPSSVWEAINQLPVSRIGHGVRAVEDPILLTALHQRHIALEVCPGSNIALKIYPSLQQHPWPTLQQAGLLLSLNSDDPPYFATSLGQEYATAQEYFQLNDAALIQVTQMAIASAFVDSETRRRLLASVDSTLTLPKNTMKS